MGNFEMAQLGVDRRLSRRAELPAAALRPQHRTKSNEARFKLPEYDRLYEKSLTVPDGPDRNRLYREMDRLMLAYAPWRLGVTRRFNHLQYPWVKGYKKHPILY